MYRVTFDQFLQHTAVYERTPVQISPGLRRGVWFSWLIIAVCALIFYFLPDGDTLKNSIFFYWTKGWMANIWNFIAVNRPHLLIVNLAVLVLAFALLILTRGYHQAEIGLQIILFVPVVYATANLLFVLILLLPILANLIVWILLFTCTAVTCLLFLTLAARHI